MFWVISTILIVIALAFIMPSLLKKEFIKDATSEQNIAIAKEQLADLELRFEQGDIDPENYQITRDEIERSLFDDLKTSEIASAANTDNGASTPSKSFDTWLILLLVPLIAIPVYLNIGNLNFTKEFDSKKMASEFAQSSIPLMADGSPDIEQVTNKLKLEMESNPTDPRGWYMLGRSYMLLERFTEASESFDKSLSLRPDLADTMLSLAEALSMENNGQLIGRPRQLVAKALTVEPLNMTALWLSGMAASQEKEYVEAISHWKKVLPLLEDRPDEKTAISGLIAEAESRILAPDVKKEMLAAISQNNEKENTPEKNNKEIKVKITISDSFNDKVSPDDLVFIYAKAMDGPPVPLAAVRKQVKDFPLELVLNDDMAMVPTFKLSSFSPVIVGARISKSGEAIAQNGDMFVEKTEINLGDSISLEIDQIYKK